jgi:hypothetical protein
MGISSVVLVKAVATDAITYSDVSVATKTVQIGSVVYTAHAGPTTTANEYKVSASTEELAAQYLVECINASGTAGNFGSLTVPHPDVVATQNGAIVILTARVAGTIGGSIALVTDESNGIMGGASIEDCAGTSGAGRIDLWVPAILAIADLKSKAYNALRELIGV